MDPGIPIPATKVDALFEWGKALKGIQAIDAKRIELQNRCLFLESHFPFLSEIDLSDVPFTPEVFRSPIRPLTPEEVEILSGKEEKKEEKTEEIGKEDKSKGKNFKKNAKMRKKVKEKKKKESGNPSKPIQRKEEEITEDEITFVLGHLETSSEISFHSLGIDFERARIQCDTPEMKASRVKSAMEDIAEIEGPRKKSKSEGGIAPPERSTLEHVDGKTRKNLSGNPILIQE